MRKIMKEQAQKLANETIDQASEEARSSLASSGQIAMSLIDRVQESNRARETEGRNAWSNLKRLGGQRLPVGDQVTIARHLYDEMVAVRKKLRSQNTGIGKFCIKYKISDASESSKELHRLILPPDKDPAKVRLRRSAGKYRQLISGIGDAMGEDPITVADRVLRGTSLHPARMDDLSETEMVQVALQRIVDKIDYDFGVREKFMDIAELKIRHLTEGGTNHWPLWGPMIGSDPSAEDIQNYEREFGDAIEERFAFWKRAHDAVLPAADYMWWPMAYESGVLQDNDFFYVPHTALGFIEYANLPSRRKSPAMYGLAVQTTVRRWQEIDENQRSRISDRWAVTDEWDEEAQRPIGQVARKSSQGTDFAWIVIYPMPGGLRLMPMLYVPHEEGGAYLLPLDVRNLEILREAIWIGESEHMTVFDRIKKLLGGSSPDSRSVIEEGFRRTAPWLDHNPFFKMRRQRHDELQMLRAFCHQLWDEKKSC